jgi:phage tail sheath protein FI
MTSETILFDRDALRDTFDEWATAADSLDAQLSESLSALAAYQSHLDAWQRQLADERTDLIRVREQFEREQAAAAERQTHSYADSGDELIAARQKVADLTSSLLARTEELSTLDSRRGELVAELELARDRELALTTALDEQQRLLDQERAKWTNGSLEATAQRGENVKPMEDGTGENAGLVAEPSRRLASSSKDRSNSSAVLSSIVEQFGKLRQQRAVERQTSKKTR